MANYTKWTSWGTTNTSPLIGLEISTSVYSATQIKVQYSFKYHKRWNYTSDQVWLNCPTYLDSYIDSKTLESQIDFKAYSSTYPNIGIYTIFTGERIFDRQSADYNVKFKLSANWNGLTWDGIKDSDAPNARIVEIDVKIDKYIQLSSPTINTDLGIIAPINSIDISWNKIENASSYLLTIKDSNGNNLYGPENTSNTKLTSTFSNLDSYRGRQLMAYIQAIGSSDYMDSITSSKVIATINTLPGAPSVSQSGTNINTNTSISFYVTAGSSGNTGQSASLYYSLNGSEKYEFTSPLVLNANEVISGSNTINFYTYDGLEYSSPTTKTFSATSTSTLTSVNVTHSYVKSMDGSANLLVKESNIVLNLSEGTINNIRIGVRTSNSKTFSGDGVDITSKCSYNSISQIIYVPVKEISEIQPGLFFSFRVSVNGSSSEWLDTQCGRKPQIPRTHSSFSCSGEVPSTGQYKEKVKITASIPLSGTEYATLSSLALVVFYSDKNTSLDIVPPQSLNDKEFNLSFVPQGEITSFSLRVKDEAGQSVTSEILGSLVKASSLNFPNQIAEVNKSILKPFSDVDKNCSLSHSAITTSEVTYTYKIRINGVEYDITPFETKIEGSTIWTKYSVDDINDFTEKNHNTSYTAAFIIKATDTLGSSTSIISQSFIIDYREAPIFNSKPFKIKHDYDINNVNDSTKYLDVPTNENDDNFKTRAMFNTGEGIVFCLPIADDANNDISEYQIFLSRTEFNGIGTVTNVGFNSQPWISIPYQDLKKAPDDSSDSGYYYYRYTATQYNKNEAFFFKVRVKDSQGNYSDSKEYNGYIIGCRTVQPKFSINLQNIERNGTIATLKYTFKIDDLGGSSTSSGWNPDFYNNYRNFERQIDNYTPSITLKVEISSNDNFTEVKTNSITSNSSYLSFTGTTSISSGKGIEVNGVPTVWDKLFVRFTLTLSYTLNGYLVSSPFIIPWSGTVPTVSHRAHRVGINTNTFEDNEILVIEPYQQSRTTVVLRGGDKTITIDLINGTINGAIISGGTW